MALVCACKGGRTRQASKRRPRAVEVIAKSRHVLRVLEIRCLPLGHFQVLAFERSTNQKDVTKDRNLNTFKMYCKRRKSCVRFPAEKQKIVCMRVIALLAMSEREIYFFKLFLLEQVAEACAGPAKENATEVLTLSSNLVNISFSKIDRFGPAGRVRITLSEFIWVANCNFSSEKSYGQ